MGVLKVNVGTDAVPDWRKAGCGGAAAGTTQVAPWEWLTEPTGTGGPGQTITFQATSAPSGYHSVYVNLTWDDAGTPGSSSAGVPYPGSSTAVHSLALSTLPVGATLLSAVAQWSPNGSDIYDVLTWTAATTGRLKLWDGTQWLREACDDDGGTPTITDTFTRADSTTSLGSPWTLAGSGAWGISSNRGYKVSGFGIPYVTAGYGDQDVTVTMYRAATSGSSRIYLRANFSADFYYVVELTGAAGMTVTRASGTAFVAMTAVSGVGTPFATWTGTETVWRATIIGGTINVYCNGVLAARYVDSVPLPSTNTQVGIESTENGPTAAYFDDFSVGEATTVVGHPLKVNIGTADAPDWVTVACLTPA